MQFVIDKFHTVPCLTVSVFLVVGQKVQFLNWCSFIPLPPAISALKGLPFVVGCQDFAFALFT